jgi:hypothetical protein
VVPGVVCYSCRDCIVERQFLMLFLCESDPQNELLLCGISVTAGLKPASSTYSRSNDLIIKPVQRAYGDWSKDS